MAYTVDYSDSGKSAIVVRDQTINSETSLSFVGKNFFGYGEIIAENFLHLLENFSSVTPPPNPTEGQIWFKSSEENFYYYDGTDWKYLTLSTVGPITITDNGSTDHVVTGFFDEGNIIAVVSSETFVVSSSDPVYSQFTDIGAGITLASGTKLHGTATTAEYADLAEMYSSDTEYEAGTVVKIGGEAEVTQTTDAFCPNVFGIVSTDPAYLMNSKLAGTRVAVALEGRVPCKVIGPCKKGDRLVTSEVPGVARAVTDYELQESLDWYRQVGRALADKTTESIGLVEVVVGAK
jgi:hypothetical protein